MRAIWQNVGYGEWSWGPYVVKALGPEPLCSEEYLLVKCSASVTLTVPSGTERSASESLGSYKTFNAAFEAAEKDACEENDRRAGG
jgi:hypothetical protein